MYVCLYASEQVFYDPVSYIMFTVIATSGSLS